MAFDGLTTHPDDKLTPHAKNDAFAPVAEAMAALLRGKGLPVQFVKLDVPVGQRESQSAEFTLVMDSATLHQIELAKGANNAILSAIVSALNGVPEIRQHITLHDPAMEAKSPAEVTAELEARAAHFSPEQKASLGTLLNHRKLAAKNGHESFIFRIGDDSSSAPLGTSQDQTDIISAQIEIPTDAVVKGANGTPLSVPDVESLLESHRDTLKDNLLKKVAAFKAADGKSPLTAEELSALSQKLSIEFSDMDNGFKSVNMYLGYPAEKAPETPAASGGIFAPDPEKLKLSASPLVKIPSDKLGAMLEQSLLEVPAIKASLYGVIATEDTLKSDLRTLFKSGGAPVEDVLRHATQVFSESPAEKAAAEAHGKVNIGESRTHGRAEGQTTMSISIDLPKNHALDPAELLAGIVRAAQKTPAAKVEQSQHGGVINAITHTLGLGGGASTRPA